MTVPDEQTHTFADLPVTHTDRKTLDWLGFCALADADTAFHLDDLKLEEISSGRTESSE